MNTFEGCIIAIAYSIFAPGATGASTQRTHWYVPGDGPTRGQDRDYHVVADDGTFDDPAHLMIYIQPWMEEIEKSGWKVPAKGDDVVEPPKTAIVSFGSYPNTVSGVSTEHLQVGPAYAKGVYSPIQNRIYFVPLNVGPIWHYIDCNTGEIMSYNSNVELVNFAYSDGVYCPLQAACL